MKQNLSDSQPTRSFWTTLENQLWPVAALVSGSAVMAWRVVVEGSTFESPDWQTNSWVRLGGLILASLAALALLSLWRGQGTRRLQFCLAASILGHVALAHYSREWPVALLADAPRIEAEPQKEPEVQPGVPGVRWELLVPPAEDSSGELAMPDALAGDVNAPLPVSKQTRVEPAGPATPTFDENLEAVPRPMLPERREAAPPVSERRAESPARAAAVARFAAEAQMPEVSPADLRPSLEAAPPTAEASRKPTMIARAADIPAAAAPLPASRESLQRRVVARPSLESTIPPELAAKQATEPRLATPVESLPAAPAATATASFSDPAVRLALRSGLASPAPAAPADWTIGHELGPVAPVQAAPRRAIPSAAPASRALIAELPRGVEASLSAPTALPAVELPAAPAVVASAEAIAAGASGTRGRAMQTPDAPAVQAEHWLGTAAGARVIGPQMPRRIESPSEMATTALPSSAALVSPSPNKTHVAAVEVPTRVEAPSLAPTVESQSLAAMTSVGPALGDLGPRRSVPTLRTPEPIREPSPSQTAAAIEPGLSQRRSTLPSSIARAEPVAPPERVAALPPIDAQVSNVPAVPFRQRSPAARPQVAMEHGGTSGSERSVEAGLEFLSRWQFADGHWSLHELPPGLNGANEAALGNMQSDTAATGLALLSYLGAGYTHRQEKHRAAVDKGLRWLMEHQRPDGDLYTGGASFAWLYSHGIASIVLCEAYGMTRDPQLMEPARRAIEFILRAQDRQLGGWRYVPGEESDTSVTGWQLMALKSAQMAGFTVPAEALAGVNRWLDLARSADGSRYVYHPLAADNEHQRHGRSPNLPMTAKGMLMRLYLGRPPAHPAMVEGAEYLRANLPQWSSAAGPTRDAYYWYCGTQVMFQMGGSYWTEWNKALHPLLEESQIREGALAGSWDPRRPVPDRWAELSGRVYVTTMHLLMLEVYYRHLPLYQSVK